MKPTRPIRSLDDIDAGAVTRLPACVCGQPGVVFSPGAEGVRSEVVGWIQRPIPAKSWCLDCARQAGWPHTGPMQFNLL